MNPTFDSSRPLAPLAQRRRAVLIGVFGFVLMLLSQFLSTAGVSRPVEVITGVAGIVTVVFGWSRLVFGLVGLPQLDQPGLDERQRAVVTAAYAAAYRVLASGLLLSYTYVMLTNLFAGLPKLTDLASSSLMLVGLIWLVIGLPAAILAWTEPDPTD